MRLSVTAATIVGVTATPGHLYGDRLGCLPFGRPFVAPTYQLISKVLFSLVRSGLSGGPETSDWSLPLARIQEAASINGHDIASCADAH